MGENMKSLPNEFIDLWKREDGILGNGWIDAFEEHPKWWDQFRIVNGSPVIPDPDKGPILQKDCSAARAAFYREFGTDFEKDIAASMIWSGKRPYEGTPLIHVNPDDSDFGIGAWYVSVLNSFLIGAVGRRPDQFRVIQAVHTEHVDNVQRKIEIRSSGTEFSVWFSKTNINDPEMVQIGMTHKVPAGLVGASAHGAAIDLNQDPARPANQIVLLPPYRLYKL